jgi:flagellar biosynthetic protein FliR
VPPATLLEYLAAIGIELAVGLSLGYGIMLLLAGMQLAGQIIGLTSGMTLADTFNPGFDTTIPLVSQFLYLLALAVFVAIGGHRLLLQGLLTTFDAMPAGGAFLRPSLLETLITLLSQSLSMAVCAAAPATVALLLATLVLGLISRTLPQLNVMALGFGASSLVALAVLAASLAGMAWAFESAVAPAIETMVESMAGM